MKRLPLLVLAWFVVPCAHAADHQARLALYPRGERAARSQGAFIEVTSLRSKSAAPVSLDGAEAVWTSAGKTLVISRVQDGRRRLFEIGLDGSKARLLTDGSVPGDEMGPSVHGEGVFFSIGSVLAIK